MPRKKQTIQRQSIQIIGGAHRHRKIDFIAADDLRPTGARLRETLFNWLQPYLYEARCLDLFAGSGILGFEAVSRGAKSVTFVEKHRQIATLLKQNVATLKLDNTSIINTDACEALVSLGEFEIVFLDPPYKLRWLPNLLDDIKLLAPKLVFIEDNEPFEDWVKVRGDYKIIKSKKAGNIYYGLLCPIVK